MELGDVGDVDDMTFTRHTTSDEIGFSLPAIEEAQRPPITTGGRREAHAGEDSEYRIRFHDERPLLLLGDCRTRRFADELVLAEQMLEAWRRKRLAQGADIVIKEILVSAAVVIVPERAGAEVSFDLDPLGSPFTFDLATALAGASLRSQSAVSITFSSQRPTVVGIRGLQIRTRNWGPVRFRDEVVRVPSDDQLVSEARDRS